MLCLSPLEYNFKGLKLVAVADCNGLKTLNFNGKLVDDTPSDDLLASDPGPGLLIVSLAEEQLQVKQVAEAATLKNLHLNAWEKGHIFERGLFRDILESTYETT